MRPGGPAVWGEAFQAAIGSHDALGYGKLVGAFHSELGLQNRGKGGDSAHGISEDWQTGGRGWRFLAAGVIHS